VLRPARDRAQLPRSAPHTAVRNTQTHVHRRIDRSPGGAQHPTLPTCARTPSAGSSQHPVARRSLCPLAPTNERTDPHARGASCPWQRHQPLSGRRGAATRRQYWPQRASRQRHALPGSARLERPGGSVQYRLQARVAPPPPKRTPPSLPPRLPHSAPSHAHALSRNALNRVDAPYSGALPPGANPPLCRYAVLPATHLVPTAIPMALARTPTLRAASKRTSPCCA